MENLGIALFLEGAFRAYTSLRDRRQAARSSRSAFYYRHGASLILRTF